MFTELLSCGLLMPTSICQLSWTRMLSQRFSEPTEAYQAVLL